MKKRNFVLRGLHVFNSAERICGSAGAKLQAGETSPHFPSPRAKFRTADKPVSESRNHGSGSEVMTGASAKEFQDAGEGSGVRGNKGFTLAEVLITLVIIGVIGALTVPALIQNTQKQEYVSALKKAYSTLSQATQQIITEEGSPKCDDGGWACTTEQIFDLYKKYIMNIKDCGTGQGCFSDGDYRDLNGYTFKMTGYGSAYHKMILSDGVSVMLDDNVFTDCSQNWYGSENNCVHFFVDINGAKGPNTRGRDLFYFGLTPNGLVPWGCSGGWCNGEMDNGSGHGCACKVLTEGAMNY